jgi:hypothetical protein
MPECHGIWKPFNLPEPSGPHRPVMGMLYLYIHTYTFEKCLMSEFGEDSFLRPKVSDRYKTVIVTVYI